MIRVSGLCFSYSRKPVLQGCSFGIEPGDFCAIVGPNGSGKTTLLKLIAGILEPQGGEISLDGRPLSRLSVRDRAQILSYVSQRQEVVFDFPVFDTVLLGRNPYQSRWAEAGAHDREVVERVLEQTGLLPFRDRMLTELSGGEAQRVMIARAMAQETPLMLLDEPLSNLDITHQFAVMDILQQLNNQKNTTILIVLHDFSFLHGYANKTLMLCDGKLQHFGPTEEVITPEHIRETFHLDETFSVDAGGHVIRTTNH